MGEINYLEILEQAWAQHLAPREPNAPTLVSTFAGCGGSSLGYSMAGFRELLAVEWNDNAVETFKLNFPGVPVYHGDIAKLSVDECLRLTGLRPGELDLLDGSPPCQGFSTAGKRNMDDDRNQLFREFVRLLRGLKPKVFVMENVSGLVKGKMKLVFAEIMRELKASGYQVRCKLLNAMYFNVPQSRQRLIFIGVRDDLGVEVSFPGAQSKLITVRDAIGVGGAQISRSGYGKGYSSKVNARSFDKVAQALTKQETLMSTFLTVEETDIARDMPAPRLSGLYLEYWIKATEGESVGKFSQNIKLCASAVCPTVVKSEGYGGVYHPFEPRGLSAGERKRLASFPDEFKFTDWKSSVERIGNSVPPLMMKSIAEHIKKEILTKADLLRGETLLD